METLRCVGRAELQLSGSFADMILLPSAGAILSGHTTALFVLTSPGRLNFFDHDSLSALASQHEKIVSISSIEYPMVTPTVDPIMTVAKPILLSTGENSSKTLFEITTLLKHGSTPNMVVGTKWPMIGGIANQLSCAEAGSVMDHDAKKWPDAQTDDSSSFYKVPFSSIVYIERTDFRIKDSKDYYGLAPGKTVLLRYAFPIKCTEVVLGDDKESVLEIRMEYDSSKKTKPKGVLHWVAEPSPGVDPLKVEVRLFDRLFLSENPAELDDWLGDLNPESKVVMPCAYAVPTLRLAAVGDSFQFERLGYFVVDKDSTSDKLVFNRTVTLRDNYAKGGK